MRVVIIGGGVTGLAAAHRLQELARERGASLELHLLEGSSRFGGAIGTERRDGFVLEEGPDSMITDKPWGLALARRLGLEGEVVGTQDVHRRSFVVRNGRLMPVPEGFQLLAPSKFGPLARTPIFSWPGKVRMALDLLIPPRGEEKDESLGSFVLRRLGREALERMAQPMIAGIYGADPMELSLQATLPRFLDMERQHGSVIRAMWARGKGSGSGRPGENASSGVSGARYGLFVSFREGMQTLIEALERSLPAEALHAETPVERLERSENGWTVYSGSRSFAADAVIVALPTHRAAPLFHELDPELERLLGSVAYADAATMTLAYRTEDVPHPLDGFGFVVPAVEGLTILGCTFTHRKWPHRAPEGVALLRAFLGEAGMRGRDEPTMEQAVREDLRRVLGITAEPLFRKTWCGRKVMPQYHVGHLERVREMERRAAALPGLALAGNGYRGVGIPDSIHSAEQAAEAVFRELGFV